MTQPMKQKYLSVEAIRAASDMETLDIEVPAWGGTVKVKPLSMAERRSVRQAASRPRKQPDGSWGTEIDAEELELEALVQGCIEPRFDRGDKDWLREEKSAGAINRVATRVLELSGLGGDDQVKKPSGSS